MRVRDRSLQEAIGPSGLSELGTNWSACGQTIDNLHEIIVRNAEKVAFSGTLGQDLDRAQKRKLGEELRRVEGRVFGSWRVEVIVGRSICGCPLYQLLSVLPRVRAGACENARAKPNLMPSRAAPRRAHARAGRRRASEPCRSLETAARADTLLGAPRPRHGPLGRWAGKQKGRPGPGRASWGRQSPSGGWLVERNDTKLKGAND